MRRQMRRNYTDERESKKMLYIAGGVLLLAIVAFVVTFIIYSNVITEESEQPETTITDLATTNAITSQASSSIGKTVNEVEQSETEQSNVVVDANTKNEGTLNESLANKIAINTSAQEKKQITNTTVNTNTTEGTQTTTTQTKEEKKPDPTFTKPVEGEMTKEYAKDNLIYSETLEEWVTHYGIDIKADKTTVVKASAGGTIKSIKNDPRYGITVTIEHDNGYQSVYANLLTAEFVKEGEKVEQGQTIGTVGNTATFEIADDPHLHFEILKDGEYIDPSLYIK